MESSNATSSFDPENMTLMVLMDEILCLHVLACFNHGHPTHGPGPFRSSDWSRSQVDRPDVLFRA